MYYVFTHIFWCLLAAALLGGLIGWLLRGFGFGSKLAELEADWGGRLGLVEGEKAQLATQVRESQTTAADWKSRFTVLEADHGKLKTGFADLSGKVPALEAAVAGWVAKGTAWDSEAAKLQVDLQACADARGRLESTVGEWAAKAKAWDTDRAELVAKVRDAEAQLSKAQADDKLEDQRFRDQVEALRAEAAGMQAKWKRAQEDDARDDAAYEKTISELRGTIAKLEGESNDYKARIQKLVETDKANDAAYEKRIAGLQSQIASLETEAAVMKGKLQEAAASDKAGKAAYEQTIAGYEIERGEWAARAQDLEGRLSAAAPPLAMAAAAAAGGAAAYTETSERVVPEARYEELNERFRSFVIRTQKGGWGDIERIEGIGPVYGQKLRSIGIAWVKDLLEEGAEPEGRKRIEAESGIDPQLILTWVNHADLLRVEGVTPDWAELLEASGVDTVKELRNRVPENLQKKMEETNPKGGQGRYAPTVPDIETVRGWVAIAKALGPKVTH